MTSLVLMVKDGFGESGHRTSLAAHPRSKRAQVAAISNESEKARPATIARIYDDQQRLRENLKALKGPARKKKR